VNYEELYTSVQGLEKELGDRMKTQQRLFKNLQKSMEKGDLKSWLKDADTLRAVCEESADAVERMRSLAEAFPAREYMENGEFAEQMLHYCAEAGLDAKGDFPVYEMFPYKVKIDAENLELYVDRKKVQCLRPQSFVGEVKAGRDKLLKAAFNAAAFAGELAEAYDLALLWQSKGKAYAADADCYLLNLYKYLAPMGRYRREYDRQSFAFDLARLYASDVEAVKDGRRFQFGPSRNNNKAIRILDGDGQEQFLATIRFYG